jgi:hypothetical protein
MGRIHERIHGQIHEQIDYADMVAASSGSAMMRNSLAW